MRKRFLLAAVALPLIFSSSSEAVAMHGQFFWVQENSSRLDINFTNPAILANDFQYASVRPIYGIGFHGSWLNDRLPRDANGVANFALVDFEVSIFSNVPATATTPGVPGEKLWSKTVPSGSFEGYCVGPSSRRVGFYDPALNRIIGNDSFTCEYDFYFSAEESFIGNYMQTYWLGLQAFPKDPNAFLGWTTSEFPFAAYSVNGQVPGSGLWHDLHDPASGQGLDLNFALTQAPEPACTVLVLGWLFTTRRRRR